jgi:hypothetical protein
MTLSGPPDAFPDLNEPTKRAAVAASVRSALNLGADYPISNILVWLQSQQDVAAPPTRRLTSTSTRVMVIAYTLVRTDKLPELTTLLEAIAAPDLTAKIAEKLAEEDFVSEDNLGKLVVVLVATPQQLDKVVNALQGTSQNPEEAATLQQLLQPIGKHW